MRNLFLTKPGFSIPIQLTAVWLGSREFCEQLKKTLHTHATLVALIVCYASACLIAAQVFDMADRMSLLLYSKSIGVIALAFLIAFLCGHAIYIMIFVRPEYLTKHILNDLRNNYLSPERIMTGLPILVFMPVFISGVTSCKIMIPVINPYSWDPVFAEWDSVIHGGIQPWLLLQPLLRNPLVTSVFSFLYNSWLFVMCGVLFWQAFSLRDPRLRMQFFLTFICSWALLGNVVATLLSSAGPCYYGRATGLVDPFQPLMDYLRAANETFPVWSLRVQEMLWEMCKKGGIGFGNGISAMPSLHVSMSFLFALVGWRTHRALGIGFTVFAVFIMIGSVHLGWHYAIDGYAAIIGTWLIWFAVGWLLSRHSAFRGS